jgi:hypothetical protein
MSGYEIWKKKRRKSDHSLNSNSTFESAVSRGRHDSYSEGESKLRREDSEGESKLRRERDAQDLKKVLVPDLSSQFTLTFTILSSEATLTITILPLLILF